MTLNDKLERFFLEHLATPIDGKDLAGTVGTYAWRTRVSDVRKRFTLCGSLRRPEGIRVRVLADACPHADAQAVAPELEDAYAWLTGRTADAAHARSH